MKKLKALIVMCLATAMLVGCGSGSAGSDTYVFTSELDIKNLDSCDADDGMSFNAMHACIDGLMGLDEEGNITGAIAESYDLSDDQKTYTFHLREDANWANGTPVTADDFVYAWQRILKNNGNYAYMLGSDGAAIVGVDEILTKMADKKELTDADFANMGVKAVDDKTLEVTITRPISYFDELMTFPCYYPINQEFCEEKGDQYAKTAENVLSNGAYVMKTWEPGKQATFEKNDKYWNADAVKTQKLVMNIIPDLQTAATSFENGETDFAPINSQLVDKYKNEDYYVSFNEGYLFYLEINEKNTDLANNKIKQALSLAIDREDFVTNVLKDGSKAAKGFVPRELSVSPTGTDFRDDAGDYDVTSYNLEKAQQLFAEGLKELGKTSINVRLTYGTDESPMDQMAEYLQNAFSKLDGLNIEMVATTKQDRIYTKMANGDFDIACTRWGPDYGDPTTYLNLLLDGNSNNYGKYYSEEYEAVMEKVSTEEDAATRWQYMIDAEKIAMTDLPNIPVFEKGTSALENQNVKGLVHRPVGVPYTFHYVEKAE
ncbi:peptide ABC transporter substrate-binding protein [Massilimicrobiota timonensis]|uniref:Peptide ABC transporter substrate-binding protein n=1 Tax=Massilimicrobiota timonensis TaxID=1776392 RepID=A0ABT7UKY7_9FIRM|nr:peptide ABC transporter substrate-binding protein [Massilimicrobiota timonensis]MDM8196801.1 peptide ABC transporter substrate-binding protein [Massilimicrobiota timonensis]